MSQENVETVRRIIERWAAERTIDPGEFDPDFVISTTVTRLEGNSRRGLQGFEEWRAATEEVVEGDWFEAEEFRDLGERVLVTGWLRMRGVMSAAEARTRYVQLWSFRGGRPYRIIVARTEEEALEAIELPESAAGDGASRGGPTRTDSAEIVESVFAAIDRRDRDAALALIHPEVEFQSLIAEAEGGTYRGHEGFRAWWDAVAQSLGGLKFERERIESFRERGIIHLRIVGAIGESELSQRMWMAWRARDGRAVWWAIYRSEHEALEAVGLSE